MFIENNSYMHIMVFFQQQDKSLESSCHSWLAVTILHLAEMGGPMEHVIKF